MDIQKIQERFEDLMLANPDFDEGLLEKDEEGCYVDSNIAGMYSMFEAGIEVGEAWQAAKKAVVQQVKQDLIDRVNARWELAHQQCVENWNTYSPAQMDAFDYIEQDINEILCEAMIEAQEPSND